VDNRRGTVSGEVECLRSGLRQERNGPVPLSTHVSQTHPSTRPSICYSEKPSDKVEGRGSRHQKSDFLQQTHRPRDRRSSSTSRECGLPMSAVAPLVARHPEGAFPMVAGPDRRRQVEPSGWQAMTPPQQDNWRGASTSPAG
jgi:hypothetical protein